MYYEEFKHLAEHPHHRDVPAIFKIEVLETEELEEKDKIFCQAHECSIRNKEQIEKSEKCGCFFCGEIFSPSEITDYLPDEPPTAECPFCHTDSVIGDASGFPITKDFLKKNEEEMVLWRFFNVFIYLPPLSHRGCISHENGH